MKEAFVRLIRKAGKLFSSVKIDSDEEEPPINLSPGAKLHSPTEAVLSQFVYKDKDGKNYSGVNPNLGKSQSFMGGSVFPQKQPLETDANQTSDNPTSSPRSTRAPDNIAGAKSGKNEAQK